MWTVCVFNCLRYASYHTDTDLVEPLLCRVQVRVPWGRTDTAYCHLSTTSPPEAPGSHRTRWHPRSSCVNLDSEIPRCCSGSTHTHTHFHSLTPHHRINHLIETKVTDKYLFSDSFMSSILLLVSASWLFTSSRHRITICFLKVNQPINQIFNCGSTKG
jgi:hypothetical protein